MTVTDFNPNRLAPSQPTSPQNLHPESRKPQTVWGSLTFQRKAPTLALWCLRWPVAPTLPVILDLLQHAFELIEASPSGSQDLFLGAA